MEHCGYNKRVPLASDSCIICVVVTVEILAIGNEILLGLIEDTNSSYLCRAVRGMGGRVSHIATVRDDMDAIAAAIRASIERGAKFVLTSGGLGPTDDDLTLAGIAKATQRKLEIDADAKAFVERRYRELASSGYVTNEQLSEARLKMAYLPEGARPIENPVGAAPAVVLDAGETKIVSLPGVPAELKAIVEGPLQGFLSNAFGRGSYRERTISVRCGDESELAPILRRVASIHPEVYLKSRASHFGLDVRFNIMICASGVDSDQAEQMIVGTASDLKRALEEIGIRQDE